MNVRTIVMVLLVIIVAGGCVERKMTVTSNPPGALVYLDDEEKGYTPVTFRFNFYGSRTLTLHKDGYRVTEEVQEVKRPIYETPGLAIFADLLPIPLKDHNGFHFALEPVKEVSREELFERARLMKERVLREDDSVGSAPASP